jgi:hypothetical protein
VLARDHGPVEIRGLALGFVVAYVTLFALLDHWYHFQSGARILALILLIAGVAALAIWRATRLKTSVSLSHTADYIEGKFSFYRQLVTAMEYYEDQQHYSYSQSLAQLLIRRIHSETKGLDFSGFVDKWPTFGWASGILIAVVVVVLFAVDNYRFFTRHVHRLVSPTAAAEVLRKPELTSVTKDIMCEPNTIVKFTARLDSVSDESIRWILKAEQGAASADGIQPLQEEMTVKPTAQADGTTLFEHRKFFETTGTFAYQFQGPQGDTEAFKVTVSECPKVKSLHTRISASGLAALGGPNDSDWEGVTDHQIEIVAGSKVCIAVQASEGVERVDVQGPDGRTESIALQGQDQFIWTSEPRTNGSVRFNMVNRLGQTNWQGSPVDIVVKQDRPPRFAQISPEKDISVLRTDKVPIEFTVTDDVGLQSVQFHWEISGRTPKHIEIPLELGAREVQVSWEVVCAEHRLDVGDSVFYHVSAADISPAEGGLGQEASSELGLIEIRPDQQRWLLMPAQASRVPGPRPNTLMDILECTRALLKKTWNAAQGPSHSSQAKAVVESLCNDAQFCRSALEMNRDNPGQGFSDAHRAKLSLISRRYKKAEHELHSNRPAQALKPLKQAYQLLRKFVDERILIYRLPSPGPAPEEKRPEQIRLAPTLVLSAEQNQAEQHRVQQTVEDLQRQQIRLNEAMEKLLQDHIGSSASASASGESALSSSPSQASSAFREAAQAQLDMLGAKQNAIRQATAQIKTHLEKTQYLAGDSSVPFEAERHLTQAMAQMQAVEDQCAQLSGQSDREQDAMSRALVSQVRAVQQQLQQSSRALETVTKQAADRGAQKARDLAQEMSQLAQAWEHETSPQSREAQRQRLHQAQVLLCSMGPRSRGGDNRVLVPTRDAGAGSAQMARDLASQFWSMSLNGQQQNTRPVPPEPSDIAFSSLEQAFFQRVAEYRLELKGK